MSIGFLCVPCWSSQSRSQANAERKYKPGSQSLSIIVTYPKNLPKIHTNQNKYNPFQHLPPPPSAAAAAARAARPAAHASCVAITCALLLAAAASCLRLCWSAPPLSSIMRAQCSAFAACSAARAAAHFSAFAAPANREGAEKRQ